MIRKDKKEKLEEDMEKAGIFEDDLREQFILGSGSGGQKINKTNNTVLLKHIPSGLTVRCGKDRSREVNRFIARTRLLEKYLSEIKNEETKKMKEVAKIRKQKQRRSRKVKEKMQELKQARSETKENRNKKIDNE